MGCSSPLDVLTYLRGGVYIDWKAGTVTTGMSPWMTAGQRQSVRLTASLGPTTSLTDLQYCILLVVLNTLSAVPQPPLLL